MTDSAETQPATPETATREFGETVVPITALEFNPAIKMGKSLHLTPNLGMGLNFGTGFCLDSDCRLIATNYHVAMTTRARKIGGEQITDRYFATGPHDRRATVKRLANGKTYPYASERDLAVLTLAQPLRGHRGLRYSFDELEPRQEVDIYGYAKDVLNPIRRLGRFSATYKAQTASGLLAFEFDTPAVRPTQIAGASGGIVVDRKSGKIVAVLNEATETLALAVPIKTLCDFVTKVLPFEGAKIFPESGKLSPFTPDFYPKFMPAPDLYAKFAPDRGGGIAHRPQEPHEVRVLRQNAQNLADSMRNFIAVQTYAWGTGEKEPEANQEYEVRIVDGEQHFRTYPDGKKERLEILPPRLGGWVVPSNEWSELGRMVGTELRLKINQTPDLTRSGQRMKVFQYYAAMEDNLCSFEAVDDYVFFKVDKTTPVACFGEVWADEELNILRISEHLDLSDRLKAYRGWEDYRIVVTYGDFHRPGQAPMRVPLSIFTHARFKKKVHWCHGLFTDYKMFTAESRIVAP